VIFLNQDELCNIVAEKYYDQIYRYCFSVLNGDKQAAEDCTQETFMIMIKKKKELAFEGNICVWLYKTADRVIKNYVRKEKRRGIRMSIEEVILTDDGGLSSIEEQSALECLTKDEYRLLTE
jgi:RNA polymerase sigma factor (sigma-70 family)